MRVDRPTRPDGLDGDHWRAIEEHWDRLHGALADDDYPLVVGASKDLVECVARVVLEASGEPASSNAKFGPVVQAAQKAIDRQAGRDLSQSPHVRALAGSMMKLALTINDVRDDLGTGHGRSRVNLTEDEVAIVTHDAAALWVKWALRRLEHVLQREPERLISDLRMEVMTRDGLTTRFEAIDLPHQPGEVQRALGVAVGQRYYGQGTFVPHMVGIGPAIQSGDVLKWPKEYRLGVIEGAVRSLGGYVALTANQVPDIIALLEPIADVDTVRFLAQLQRSINESGIHPTRSVEELYDLARALEDAAREKSPDVQVHLRAIAKLVDPLEVDD